MTLQKPSDEERAQRLRSLMPKVRTEKSTNQTKNRPCFGCGEPQPLQADVYWHPDTKKTLCVGCNAIYVCDVPEQKREIMRREHISVLLTAIDEIAMALRARGPNEIPIMSRVSSDVLCAGCDVRLRRASIHYLVETWAKHICRDCNKQVMRKLRRSYMLGVPRSASTIYVHKPIKPRK